MPSKLKEEPVVSEPKSRATKKLKKVATAENKIANTNFTDHKFRTGPSINYILAVRFKIKFIGQQHDKKYPREI